MLAARGPKERGAKNRREPREPREGELRVFGVERIEQDSRKRAWITTTKRICDDSLLPASPARTPLFRILSAPRCRADWDLGLTGDRGDARPVGWEWEVDQERKKNMG